MKDIPITMFYLLRPASFNRVLVVFVVSDGMAATAAIPLTTTPPTTTPKHRSYRSGGFVLNRLTDINVS